MWSHGGLRAYYRGLTLGLLGIVPYSAIDLGCFEGMKRAYKTARMKSRGCSYEDADPGKSSIAISELGNLVVLCMGAISGSIGASIVFPINLLVYLLVLLLTISGHECKIKERHYYRTSTQVCPMSLIEQSNMKV